MYNQENLYNNKALVSTHLFVIIVAIHFWICCGFSGKKKSWSPYAMQFSGAQKSSPELDYYILEGVAITKNYQIYLNWLNQSKKMQALAYNAVVGWAFQILSRVTVLIWNCDDWDGRDIVSGETCCLSK